MGPGSEKLSNLQLELLEQEPGVSQAEVEAEGERGISRLRALAPKPSARIPAGRTCLRLCRG